MALVPTGALVIAVLSPAVLAGVTPDDKPDLRDRRAIAACEIFQKQAQQAQEAYAKAMTKAREQAITQLEKIHAELAKTTDRQETAAVQAVIDKLKTDLTDPEKQDSEEKRKQAKEKLSKLLIGTVWQEGSHGCYISFRGDGLIDISHISERRTWTVVDGHTVRMAPFMNEKTIEFTLKGDDKLVDDSGAVPIVLEFRRRKQ